MMPTAAYIVLHGPFDTPIMQDPELTRLELPSLTTVGGAFRINGQRRLESLSAPKLARTERLALTGIAKLSSICNVGLKISGITDKKNGVKFSGHCQ